MSIEISSSSFLRNNARYAPEKAIDGDFQTAWVEGDSGDGTGEWILLDFDKNVNLKYMGFITGYNKNDQAWQQNNSIQTAELMFSDNSIKNVGFFNIWRMQYCEINKTSSFVKIKITSVNKGSKYNDACISEIKPVFNDNIKFIDSIPAYREEPKSRHIERIYFTHYDFNIYPINIKFTEGLTSYFGEIEIIKERNVMVLDSICHFGQFNLDFNKILKFSLTSSEVNIISVEKRMDYRYLQGFGDAGYYYWIEDGLTNKPPLGKINDELSYYSHWEKLIPENNLYTLINKNIDKIWMDIDSLDIAIPANTKKEDEAGRQLYSKIVKKECQSCGTWDQRNKKLYAIHSVQLKINYMKDSFEKQLYIILYKSYGH
jgi:hypothetical protein